MSGFGGMLSLRVAGGREAAVRVHDALQLFVRAGSLGGVESLVSIPAAMSHRSLTPEQRRRAGVADNMIRLSVGLEAPTDLIEDLDRGLQAAG
jgi:cystathionine beta-lyase/cystathionine gamma-synthase